MTINLIAKFYCFFILFFSYLIGSLNFSILISRLCFKKEIRTLGSENAGATNMLRVFGKKAAILTFLGDFLKGTFCVFIVNLFNPEFLGLSSIEFLFFRFKEIFQMIAMVGVVLGHIFPVFYKFKGGKGISTSAGALVLIDYRIFLVTILVFVVVLAISRIVSLSSILAAIFFALFSAFFWAKHYGVNVFHVPTVWIMITIKSTFLSFIILIKHHKNIKRIINKTEPRIGR